MSWRLAIATGGYVDQPVENVLDAMHEAGVASVELGTPPRHFAPWDHAQIDAVAAALARTGITAVSVHAPFGGALDLADSNPRHRQAAIAAILTAATALKHLGGRIVVVHPSDIPRAGTDVATRLDLCVQALTDLSGGIARLEMQLVVETPLPHLIGGHPDEFARIVGALPATVGVCIDTGHAHLGRHWHRFVDVADGRLAHVHATDTYGHRDDHLPPGDGVVDWKDIVRTLRAARYAGCVVLEIGAGAEPIVPYVQRAQRQAARLLGG